MKRNFASWCRAARRAMEKHRGDPGVDEYFRRVERREPAEEDGNADAAD